MRKIIHHLRKQPEQVRRHIANICMIVVLVVLIFLWVFSLDRSFSDSDFKVKVQQDLQPFSVLKDNITDGYQNISDN